MGIFSKIKDGLTKTRRGFVSQIEKLLTGKKIDEEFFEELEDILISADVGVDTTLKIVENLRQRIKEEKIKDSETVNQVLKDEMKDMLMQKDKSLTPQEGTPKVSLVVGVNGVGKTTSIGKLAYKHKQEGKKVVLAAGDTFRAAAIDQLQIWGDRVGVDVIKHQEGADPAAVVYDAIQAGRARNADHLICDTAGRLHNKKNLMEELKKVSRIIEREIGTPPHDVYMVLDATTGQNALSQAKLFSEVTPVSGIILTKLDGTAKGGIVLALANEMEIPIKYIGVGEGMEDLQDFDPDQFIDALFANSGENNEE
ncbi:signal recognition particle-docking protein FtsY [Natranaerobius thermophilus]|uniref:Signal recognition particle receptor FtsY n=1 Tax=Natranaerobius thermophilus (strain ATCC BAA-1301 / DSM 18059 / JW/NM-WN-LF) TaxID=457570 RepID=B2A2N4_NATTJ|nr:signal recognition particle-docking protein FtsY [Natranaerobius thermophilus]ACB84949.1 signal recognition particle-docking protein FtsY [Natranaerobius thermophilus JW/NM-WN-LF]